MEKDMVNRVQILDKAVDEILQPRYVKWSTNYSDLSLNEKMASPYLIFINSIFSKLM